MRSRLYQPLIALALGLGCASTPVLADQNYLCTVDDMSLAMSNNDTDFIDKNFKKRFWLSVGEKYVTVKVRTADFNNHEKSYFIVDHGQEFMGTLKGIAVDGMSIETLVMDGKPNDSSITRATVTLQMPGVANAWHLRCQR